MQQKNPLEWVNNFNSLPSKVPNRRFSFFIMYLSFISRLFHPQKALEASIPTAVPCGFCFINKAEGSFWRQASAFELESRSFSTESKTWSSTFSFCHLRADSFINKTHFKAIQTCKLSLPVIPGTRKKLDPSFRNSLSRKWYGKEIKTLTIKNFPQPSQFLHFHHLSRCRDIFTLQLFSTICFIIIENTFPPGINMIALQIINVSHGFTEKNVSQSLLSREEIQAVCTILMVTCAMPCSGRKK